jgi:hypothetical protein
MKPCFGRVLALLSMLVLVAFAAYPQMNSKGVDFKMTRTFVLANTTFPPDRYNIKPVPGNPCLLTINGPVDHSAYFIVEEVNVPAPVPKTELTFQKHTQIVNAVKYGYSLWLTEIRVKGSRARYLVVTGPSEEMANESGESTKVKSDEFTNVPGSEK